MTPQQEKELALLTNTYFMLLEAADMILRNTEVYFEAIGRAGHQRFSSQIDITYHSFQFILQGKRYQARNHHGRQRLGAAGLRSDGRKRDHRYLEFRSVRSQNTERYNYETGKFSPVTGTSQ